MSELTANPRDARGDWAPADPIALAPINQWPPQPRATLKWFFGFPGFLRRLGVERRLYTAGEKKAILDPFSPEKAEDVELLKSLQRDVHDSFKAIVRERRAGKLKADEEVLFTGEFWTGRRALELGLIDGIGEMTSVIKERYGERVRFHPVGPRQSWLKRKLGASSLGHGAEAGYASSLAADLLAVLEERALWSRFGL